MRTKASKVLHNREPCGQETFLFAQHVNFEPLRPGARTSACFLLRNALRLVFCPDLPCGQTCSTKHRKAFPDCAPDAVKGGYTSAPQQKEHTPYKAWKRRRRRVADQQEEREGQDDNDEKEEDADRNKEAALDKEVEKSSAQRRSPLRPCYAGDISTAVQPLRARRFGFALKKSNPDYVVALFDPGGHEPTWMLVLPFDELLSPK